MLLRIADGRILIAKDHGHWMLCDGEALLARYRSEIEGVHSYLTIEKPGGGLVQSFQGSSDGEDMAAQIRNTLCRNLFAHHLKI